jgi:hypothetical protein
LEHKNKKNLEKYLKTTTFPAITADFLPGIFPNTKIFLNRENLKRNESKRITDRELGKAPRLSTSNTGECLWHFGLFGKGTF